jgi:hypothetical protein
MRPFQVPSLQYVVFSRDLLHDSYNRTGVCVYIDFHDITTSVLFTVTLVAASFPDKPVNQCKQRNVCNQIQHT